MKTNFLPTMVAIEPTSNATDLLEYRLKKTPHAALFSVPEGDGWRDISVTQFVSHVRSLAKGLIAAGIEPGDRIGLMCRTRYEWSLIDFATWYAGACLVPIYETSSAEQILHIMKDSQAVAIITEIEEHAAEFELVREQVGALKAIWRLDRGDLSMLNRQGSGVESEEVDRRRILAQGSDMATLIYTSGTSGRPKGCVLTHANFYELARNATLAMPKVAHESASMLLFISMAHVYARFEAVLSVYAGIKVGHLTSTADLVKGLATFHPTCLLSVPRVFEKLFNAAEQKAEASGKGAVFRKAADVGERYAKAVEAGKVPLLLRVEHAVFDRLVYRKIRSLLGGRVAYAISGSAPLGERLAYFYRSIGVEILEGYGLTETTAPATTNRVEDWKVGTVGKPLPGVGVAVAADGEVLVKGINVFAGYWNDPAETAKVFQDGWFATGDLGAIDEDGFLSIVGRKKEILVTAGGKNVAPLALEDPLRANPLISQVVVVGDGKPFVSALITLDEQMLPVWLENRGIRKDLSAGEIAHHPAVLDELHRAVEDANKRVSRAESIRSFRVLDRDFTIADGHLTPKLNIRRAAIVHDYHAVIEDIYSSFANDPHAKMPGNRIIFK